MGFYPKHLKQRRHRRVMNLIAKAALAGCRYKPNVAARAFFKDGERLVWCVVYPDGAISHIFTRKSGAARSYLAWFYVWQC